MRLSAVIGGLIAALSLVGAAQAGSLNIVYWGKDGSATVEIDGVLHDVGASGDFWQFLDNFSEGSHTVILHANGGTTRTNFVFDTANAAYPGDNNGPTWCIDLEDTGATLMDGDGCDEMMDYYFDGG